jgi:Big-like domain-containing protein
MEMGMKRLVILVCLLLAQPALGQVAISSPDNASAHYLNTTIQVAVDARKANGLRKVELYVDGVLFGQSFLEPHHWNLDTGSTAQWRTIRAVADYGSGGVVEDLIQIQVAGVAPALPARSVTYVGVDLDVTDFRTGVDYGNDGYWFPQFDASSPRSGKPTEDNERNSLPTWAGPMTHMLIHEVWKFPQRTFSQDGPTKSKGGFPAWNQFTLPNGEVGLSGIAFDPHGRDNTSQTVNRIMLGAGTPRSFYLRVVVDNTDLRHNPVRKIRARGDHQGVSIDPATYPQPGLAGFNGVADVYTFRYDGFEAGDFIKIQFGGMDGSTNNGGSGGSSFAGLMFDAVPNPQQGTLPPNPQPSPQTGPQTAPATSSATTAAPITQGPSPAGGGSSGGGCALSAGPSRLSGLALLVLLCAPLALRRR